jgi:hypothetical protein
MGGGGKGLFKAIVAVAVAVAVPYFAPTVAGAIFGTSSVLASAATGAVMGAAGAKLTGGDWRQGAVFGGIGGGASAYFSGAGFTSGIPEAAQGAAVAGPGANTAVITNTGSGTGYFSPELNQFIDPMTGNAIAPQNIAYGGNVTSDIATTLSSGGMNPQQLANSMTGISANTSAQGAQALGAANFYNPAAGTGNFFDAAAQTNAYAGAGQAVPSGSTLSATGTEAEQAAQAPGQPPATGAQQPPQGYMETLKARVTDPSKLADMTIMATPQIIGSIYAQQAGKEQQEQIEQLRALVVK